MAEQADYTPSLVAHFVLKMGWIFGACLWLGAIRDNCRYLFFILDNWLDGFEIAEAAELTSVVAAVRSVGFFLGFGQFLFEKIDGHAAVEMLPGQNFIERPLAQVEVEVKTAVFSGGLLPEFELEMV